LENLELANKQLYTTLLIDIPGSSIGELLTVLAGQEQKQNAYDPLQSPCWCWKKHDVNYFRLPQLGISWLVDILLKKKLLKMHR
jgi:hypothetical protein